MATQDLHDMFAAPDSVMRLRRLFRSKKEVALNAELESKVRRVVSTMPKSDMYTNDLLLVKVSKEAWFVYRCRQFGSHVLLTNDEKDMVVDYVIDGCGKVMLCSVPTG